MGADGKVIIKILKVDGVRLTISVYLYSSVHIHS